MKPTQINTHHSISLGILYPIIGLVLLGLNLIAGLLLINAARESQVTRSHLEALQRNRQNLEQLETDLLTYSGKISQILDILPQEKDIPNFIQFITDAAQTAGFTLSLNFTSNQPSQTKDKLWIIPLSLQLTATDQQLATFLQAVRNSSYQVRFNHLETEAPLGLNQKTQTRLNGQLYVSNQFANP